jgi:acetyl esterase/lipase
LLLVLVAASGVQLPSAWSPASATTIDCLAEPSPPPFAYNVQFAHPSGGLRLRLDVYTPGTGGPYPAMVMFHGGGWRSGCKAAESKLAESFTTEGFVVFVPDFRLDCNPTDPPTDIDDPKQCGYHATIPVTDAMNAIHWVRKNAAAYNALSNAVVAYGHSSGGNIALMTAALGKPGDTQPDAAGGWSGQEAMGYLADGTTQSCDTGSSPVRCRADAKDYIGCKLADCPDLYPPASPYSMYHVGSPPTLVANGTGEIISLQGAQEFYDHITNDLGVQADLCVIDAPVHGKHYQNLPCTSDGVTAFHETANFFHSVLGV